jgi:hypothetical protein
MSNNSNHGTEIVATPNSGNWNSGKVVSAKIHQFQARRRVECGQGTLWVSDGSKWILTDQKGVDALEGRDDETFFSFNPFYLVWVPVQSR